MSFGEQLPIVFSALNTGFLQTLRLFLITLVGALPLGMLLAIGEMSRLRLLRMFIRTVVWAVRGSPLMIQLLIIFYFPGLVFNTPLWGSGESGLVLGMKPVQIFFRVKLLQVIKAILPPISNEIITLVKDTSLARIIALQEIIWAGQAFMKGSQGISGAIWPLFFTGFYYLLFTGLLTLLFSHLEKKLFFR